MAISTLESDPDDNGNDCYANAAPLPQALMTSTPQPTTMGSISLQWILPQFLVLFNGCPTFGALAVEKENGAVSILPLPAWHKNSIHYNHVRKLNSTSQAYTWSLLRIRGDCQGRAR
jgi:hypothetical protein